MVRRRLCAFQMAAVKIQAVWRGILTRRFLKCKREEKKKLDWAATIIQVTMHLSVYMMHMYVKICNHSVMLFPTGCLSWSLPEKETAGSNGESSPHQ